MCFAEKVHPLPLSSRHKSIALGDSLYQSQWCAYRSVSERFAMVLVVEACHVMCPFRETLQKRPQIEESYRVAGPANEIPWPWNVFFYRSQPLVLCRWLDMEPQLATLPHQFLKPSSLQKCFISSALVAFACTPNAPVRWPIQMGNCDAKRTYVHWKPKLAHGSTVIDCQTSYWKHQQKKST